MRIIVAITGASGALYSQRLLQVLTDHNDVSEVAVLISEYGRALLHHELDVNLDLRHPDLTALGINADKCICFHGGDLFVPVASGSAQYNAMVICPCSMNTLAKVASGISDDLISRAAQVTLKESRPLVLVPRETPLSLIHLRNMVTVTEAGGRIVDANPGFYQHPHTVDDMVDFVVQRIFDQISINVNLVPRWDVNEVLE